jgi:hypothetical protein
MKIVYFTLSLLFIGINVKAQNVGIGTTTPSAKLEVTSNTNSQIVIYGNSAGQAGYGVYGAATNAGVGVLGEAYGGIAPYYSIGGWFISDGVANYALKAETITNGTAAYFSSPSGNAVIVDQGNVGIAEPAPTEKLHINSGNIKIGKTIWTTAADDKFLKFGDGGYVSIGEVGGDDKMEIKGKEITIRSNPASTGPFGSTPAGNVLIPNGNVGIGTTNPTYKLSVNGNVRSKEVVVETGWADFVFDKKYVLPSLNEVEKYIKANNHLPNIPSAEEIQTNGLKVGEIQTKMMQKIEELTLYVIELKKEIDLLKKTK